MKLWDIKAFFYYRSRRLFCFGRILDKEIEASKSLICSIPDKYEFVIDLGTGAGSTLGIYPDDVLIIGFDHSLKMIEKVSKHRRKFIGIVGSADHLPFKKSCSSMISAIGLSEYIQDKKSFLKEVKRILKKGGYVLTTISPPSFSNKLRNLLGNRIYPVDPEQWEEMCMNEGWTCLGEKSTLLQRQYLLKT